MPEETTFTEKRHLFLNQLSLKSKRRLLVFMSVFIDQQKEWLQPLWQCSKLIKEKSIILNNLKYGEFLYFSKNNDERC